MSTAKERGVKIAFPGKISYFYANDAEMGMSHVEREWAIGRYATLHARVPKDDSKIVIRLLNSLQTPRDDLNKIRFLVVDKACLMPVDDKELFTAQLKGL